MKNLLKISTLTLICTSSLLGNACGSGSKKKTAPPAAPVDDTSGACTPGTAGCSSSEGTDSGAADVNGRTELTGSNSGAVTVKVTCEGNYFQAQIKDNGNALTLKVLGGCNPELSCNGAVLKAVNGGSSSSTQASSAAACTQAKAEITKQLP